MSRLRVYSKKVFIEGLIFFYKSMSFSAYLSMLSCTIRVKLFFTDPASRERNYLLFFLIKLFLPIRSLNLQVVIDDDLCFLIFFKTVQNFHSRIASAIVLQFCWILHCALSHECFDLNLVIHVDLFTQFGQYVPDFCYDEIKTLRLRFMILILKDWVTLGVLDYLLKIG